MFHNPSDIEIDNEGNIYILDSGNFCVKKFDKNGNFLRRYGKKGKGPGEFTEGNYLEIDHIGNIYIIGFNEGIVLNPQGEEIRSYGRKNPGVGIIIQNDKTGEMVFLRRPPKG